MANLVCGVVLMGAGAIGQSALSGTNSPLALLGLGGFMALIGVYQVGKAWVTGPRVHPEAVPEWTPTALSMRRAMASSPPTISRPEPYRPCPTCGTMLPARTDRCQVCAAELSPAWQMAGEWRLESHGATYRWDPFSGNWELAAAQVAGAGTQ